MRQIENKLIVLLVIALYLCLRAQAEPSTRPQNASISQERKSALWWLKQASQEAAAINPSDGYDGKLLRDHGITQTDLKTLGLEPWDGREKAYWLLSRAQVNVGDFDGARRSLREWSRFANYMQVYLQEATACFKLGNQRGYRASMNKAIHLAPKNLFTRDIIEVYLDCQDPNGATRYADSHTSLEGKRAYQEIACYWACLGKTDQMNTLLATRFEPSYREYVIVKIIEVSALKGRFSVAEELLGEISEEVYQQCARRALCEAYAQAGNITKAEDIAKTIVEHCNVNSSSIISDMSESYSDAENFSMSRALVAMMSEHDNRSLALTAIARAYVKANNMERAKNLLKEVPRDYQESVYEAMIAQQVAKGQIDAAQASIEALVRITQDDPWKWGSPMKHYLDLARAAAEQGDMLNYHSFINRAIAGAEKLRYREQWYYWSSIFTIQWEVGDVKGLLSIAETNEDEAVRSGALSMAVRKFSQDGDISKAKMHAKQITSDGKPIAYAAVSSALVRADRMTEAQAFLETLTDNQERAEAYRCAALRVVNMGRQDVLIDWLKPITCPVVRFNVCLGAAQAFDEDYKKLLVSH